MKLSVWTSYYVDLSPEDAILEIAKCGYRYAELSDEHGAELLKRGDPIATGEAFGKFAREAGVELFQGHLFLGVALCAEDGVAVLKKWLDLFYAIGVKRAVLHCDRQTYKNAGKEIIYAKNKEALAELAAYLKGKDLKICLENLIAAHTDVSELLAYIDAIGDENLGICLDTGHLNLTKTASQKEFIEKAGKHLGALHIADNEGERDQHLMPFCVGQIDVFEICAALKKIGYDGLYNFEIPGERLRPIEIRAAKLRFIKECMEYVESTL